MPRCSTNIEAWHAVQQVSIDLVESLEIEVESKLGLGLEHSWRSLAFALLNNHGHRALLNEAEHIVHGPLGLRLCALDHRVDGQFRAACVVALADHLGLPTWASQEQREEVRAAAATLYMLGVARAPEPLRGDR